MGFHICNVGYMFGLPVLLFWEAPPNGQVIFVLNSTSTNPILLHLKHVNAAASRASSSRLNLLIGHFRYYQPLKQDPCMSFVVFKRPLNH